MSEPHGSNLSRENPWPGLESFAETDQDYFHGRDAEAAELARLVKREVLTVLFGRSGLGKTSLLNAGLFPLLRQEGFLPVYVRVNFASDAPLSAQVLDAIGTACSAFRVEAPARQAGDSLWAHFHRAGAAFWNERNRTVTPVLVIDQFEEAFIAGERTPDSRERSAAFLAELGDLVENRMPETVRRAIEANVGAADAYEPDRRGPRLVLSLREDFLAQMEGLKRQVPSLMRNRYRLKPMNGAQAYDVVTRSGGHLVTMDIARRIVGLAWRNTAEPPPDPAEFPGMEVDPALLSVICSELNGRRRRKRQAAITTGLMEGADREILADFYERSFEGLDPRVRTFVEDELITDRGYRDSFVLEDAAALPGLSQQAIDALVDRRLLRVDDRLGLRRLELTHDVLTKVVRESRDSRRAREAETEAEAREAAARRQQRRNGVFGVALVAGALAVVGAGYSVLRLKHEAATAAKKAIEETARACDEAANAQWMKDRAEWANNDATIEQQRADAKTREAEAASMRAAELRHKAEALASAVDLERRRARVLLQQAESTRLLAVSGDSIQRNRFDQSLLLDVEATRPLAGLEPSAQTGPTLRVSGALMRWFRNHPNLESFLYGHQGSVCCVLISPDGKTLASAGNDRNVILWDVAGHKALATLKGHEGRINHIAFSPNGKTLASAGDDRKVILWDVAGRKALATLEKDSEGGGLLAFSPDGRTLASVDGSNVILWDVAGRKALATLEGHEGGVWHLAFSPDGRTLASGDGRNVILWDALEHQELATLKAHKARVTYLAFSPDGKTLASAGDDQNVILWDVARRKAVATLEGHKNIVRPPRLQPGRRDACFTEQRSDCGPVERGGAQGASHPGGAQGRGVLRRVQPRWQDARLVESGRKRDSVGHGDVRSTGHPGGAQGRGVLRRVQPRWQDARLGKLGWKRDPVEPRGAYRGG